MSKKIVIYGVSTLVVVLAAMLLQHVPAAGAIASVYLPLAFFGVFGLDFYQTQMKEDGQSEIAVYANAGANGHGVCLDRFGFVRVPYFGQRCEHAFTPTPTASHNGGLVDRTFGYLFTSAFIFPGRVYEFVTSRS